MREAFVTLRAELACTDSQKASSSLILVMVLLQGLTVLIFLFFVSWSISSYVISSEHICTDTNTCNIHFIHFLSFFLSLMWYFQAFDIKSCYVPFWIRQIRMQCEKLRKLSHSLLSECTQNTHFISQERAGLGESLLLSGVCYRQDTFFSGNQKQIMFLLQKRLKNRCLRFSFMISFHWTFHWTFRILYTILFRIQHLMRKIFIKILTVTSMNFPALLNKITVIRDFLF